MSDSEDDVTTVVINIKDRRKTGSSCSKQKGHDPTAHITPACVTSESKNKCHCSSSSISNQAQCTHCSASCRSNPCKSDQPLRTNKLGQEASFSVHYYPSKNQRSKDSDGGACSRNVKKASTTPYQQQSLNSNVGSQGSFLQSSVTSSCGSSSNLIHCCKNIRQCSHESNCVCKSNNTNLPDKRHVADGHHNCSNCRHTPMSSNSRKDNLRSPCFSSPVMATADVQDFQDVDSTRRKKVLKSIPNRTNRMSIDDPWVREANTLQSSNARHLQSQLNESCNSLCSDITKTTYATSTIDKHNFDDHCHNHTSKSPVVPEHSDPQVIKQVAFKREPTQSVVLNDTDQYNDLDRFDLDLLSRPSWCDANFALNRIKEVCMCLTSILAYCIMLIMYR